MSSQRPGSTLTHIRLGKYGLQLLSEIVEKMTEVCEKFKNVSRTSAIASVTQTSATERELQRRKVLELRRVISHHFGVLSMIYRKFNDKISCKETSLIGLIPFMDEGNQREPPRTKQIQDLQAERDHLRMISQMKSEQIREALQIMRLLLEEINVDVKAEIHPKVAINPMQQ